ncbi:winged helix-turn-helix transcriptional regulator [Paraburkholderia sp. SG-MS1]|uniref:winged helix-turn-helix transcriptional regulator n=1 Tax=Paraburkholderia sp. SG-MS1 TaxID=2023741 RepID=UPI00313937EB
MLTVLCTKPSRLNAIKRRLDPVTHRALTEALRPLERNGLVNRRVIASPPVAVKYSITPLGRSLQDPFTSPVTWAGKHGGSIESRTRPLTTGPPEISIVGIPKYVSDCDRTKMLSLADLHAVCDARFMACGPLSFFVRRSARQFRPG